MTQTLYFDFTFMSRRDAYYLFYKNYPQLINASDNWVQLMTSYFISASSCFRIAA